MSITTLTSPESIASLSSLIRKEAVENGYTEQEQAYCVYSDVYKEDYGVRPRFAAQFTFEELVNSIISIYVSREHEVEMQNREMQAREQEKQDRAEVLRKATTPTPVAILGDFWPK